MQSSNPQPMKATGKLYLYGKYIFLNEIDKGIHIIDNSDPKSPRNISFINIPGNVDLAVKNGYLYADSYADLVVLDISDPTNVTPKKFIDKVFKDRNFYYQGNASNPETYKVVVGFNERDTTVECETYRRWENCSNCTFTASGRQFSTAPMSGTGGSMARFTIVSDYLYTVTNSELFSFNITDASNPSFSNKALLGSWGIETIYPFGNHLFIGSNNGMFIYNLSNPASPSFVSRFSHVSSCDPVIADDQYAYVTLRSGTECQGFTNQMEVLDITSLTQPKLVKTYPMTNPHGLAKDNDLLFLCDGKDGLKIFNSANANNITLHKRISGLETYDVILQNKIALVVATDGLYQYNYADKNKITFLSKLSIQH
jgi:hypothetical protein